MKLYTEEEMKRLLKEQIIFDDEDFDKLTPIELPSDEEIEEKAFDYAEQTGVRCWFIDGANWMKEQITKQN